MKPGDLVRGDYYASLWNKPYRVRETRDLVLDPSLPSKFRKSSWIPVGTLVYVNSDELEPGLTVKEVLVLSQYGLHWWRVQVEGVWPGAVTLSLVKGAKPKQQRGQRTSWWANVNELHVVRTSKRAKRAS